MHISSKKCSTSKCVCIVLSISLTFAIYSSMNKYVAQSRPYRLRNHVDNPNTNRSVFAVSTTENPLCPHKRQYTTSGELTEDILCFPPIKFLKNFKNPCWRSEVSRSLRCIPYFQVIGVDKCGSTDLFDRIVKHPEILDNEGVLNKETWWWPWLRYGQRLMGPEQKRYFEDFVRYFRNATKTIESTKNDSTDYHPLITGDGTPMDMWDFTGWKQIPQNKGLKEPKYITPHLIHHINPKTKFIIILRDPIKRLFSDYYFLKLHGKTRFSFHQAVENSIEELHNCEKLNSLRQCLYDRNLTLQFNKKARIHLGFYSVFLKEWLSVFPREQFLILRTEDYSSSVKQHLKQVFRFLDVRQLTDAEMDKLGMLKSKHKHETMSKKSAGKMLQETQQILTDLYKPYVKELDLILKDKRFLWDFKV